MEKQKTIQKITKYAIFNFNADDNCLIEELSAHLEKETDKIFKFFNLKTSKQKVIINIIPTKVEFDKLFKLRHNMSEEFDIGNSTRGEFFGPENVIYYLSINDYQNTSRAYNQDDYSKVVEDYKRTLVHEFVHYANKLFNIQNNNGWTSKFLVEGIATYLSKQKEGMEVPFDFEIEDLLETDMRKSCYNGYYLITKYLIENYNKEFVLELFTSSNQSRCFLENELFNKAKEYYLGKTI